jgi:polyisoprenoid-binding protein YceI
MRLTVEVHMRYSALKPGAAFLAVAAMAAAQDTAIDVQRSTITIHVGKAGLLSAAGHDHTINAPLSSGTIRESPAPHVEFTVETAKMTVKPDPKVDAKTQAEIQKDLEEMTLETRKFPEITFRSLRIEKLAEGQWKVEGDLSLHGVTKPVSLTVKRTGDSYTARTVLKQTNFGIKPISVAGGVIKVKDEVEIEFQIFPRPA